MTLDEAAAAVGQSVVYVAAHGAREDGVIVGTNSKWVFVLYNRSTKATAPEDLMFTLPPVQLWFD